MVKSDIYSVDQTLFSHINENYSNYLNKNQKLLTILGV